MFCSPCKAAAALTAILALLVMIPARAQELPPPSGRVILTVSGNIARTNSPGEARFDSKMIRALEARTIHTSTAWTDGVHGFTGVPLKVLLDEVGAMGKLIEVTAINDYAVTIPHEDWADDALILAYDTDGKPMSLRDKGPLWAIYPFDADDKYRSEVIYSRSIWQLDRIRVGD